MIIRHEVYFKQVQTSQGRRQKQVMTQAVSNKWVVTEALFMV